jgi:coenzyme F420 hydrogenase subunit beta
MKFNKTLTAKMPQDPFVGTILACEVGRATDEIIFSNSQCGGVATALLSHLFETGRIEAAIVAVMRNGTSPRGDVLLAMKPTDLIQTQKSKYTPIPLLKAMPEIEQFQGGVALVGLPCHIHGLFNLINIFPAYRKEQFYKIGLICDRVMTTAAIDFMGRKATDQPIHNFVFRDKQQRSYPGNPVVYTVPGEGIPLDASLRMSIKDFFTPVRCRLCFDKLNVFADVVLGDPHGIKEVDRIHGETLVLVRTEKGRSLVDSAKAGSSIALRKTSIDAGVKGQGIDKKRKEWANYMRAWKDLGRTEPLYPLTVEALGNTNSYKKMLLHGLSLDKVQDQTRTVNGWLFKRKMRKAVFLPLAIVNGLLRRINRTGDKL